MVPDRRLVAAGAMAAVADTARSSSNNVGIIRPTRMSGRTTLALQWRPACGCALGGRAASAARHRNYRLPATGPHDSGGAVPRLSQRRASIRRAVTGLIRRRTRRWTQRCGHSSRQCRRQSPDRAHHRPGTAVDAAREASAVSRRRRNDPSVDRRGRTGHAGLRGGGAEMGSAAALERPALPDVVRPGWTTPVDRFTAAYLAGTGGPPRELVGDAAFARRAFLDIWGLLPPPDDLRAFVADANADKRRVLIDRLLADNDAYAQHIGSRSGTTSCATTKASTTTPRLRPARASVRGCCRR